MKATTDLLIQVIPGEDIGNFEGSTAVVEPLTERAKEYMEMYPKAEDGTYQFFYSSWKEDIERGYVVSHDLTEKYTISVNYA